ncbi:unnamed protein product [Rotaria sordida]|uniref:Uncharacterized protein n=1 Tax=Rotaria sordida TaxID=392033 RepID=A0A813QTS3_9BILA|nr:unnamed protein product [Rotaria sordida]CAF3542561.1 unnamed protein product [Rotaria sordida]
MEDTKQFWDTILDYSGNAMTYTQADFELSQVYKCVDSNEGEQIKDVISMGVADGKREPISILHHIEKQGRVLPSRVIVNDISDTLFDQAKANLVNHGWVDKIGNEIIYFLGKIDEIKTELVKETKVRLGILGVYNLGYLPQALHLYQQNENIIGTKFNVYPVYLNNDEDNLILEHGETITFDITNLSDDIINQINNNVDQKKAIKAIYDKSLETGWVHDRERSGRPSLITSEKQDEIEEVLLNNSMNSVRSVSQKVNTSKSVVHRTMRDVLVYKPYKMHLTQVLYNEDKDLRIEMVEILFPILDNTNNDDMIVFVR